MRVSELIHALQDTLDVDADLAIEVATSDRKDEWYEVAEVVHETNYRGDMVFTIHTD